MAALIQDRKTDQLGTPDIVIPLMVRYPVEAATSIYAGALVAINAAGNAVPASAVGALKIVGRAERDTFNLSGGLGTISPDGIGNGTAGSISAVVHLGAFYYNINADSTITKANFGQNVYASDDNTVSLSDASGTRPYAGYILDPQQSSTVPNMYPVVGQVGVMVAIANPYALNPELGQLSAQYKARNLVTSLQAYTGTGTSTLTETANGAWAAQDGVTNAVGDIVFIQGGTTNLTAAADSGPWQISSLGSAGAKWVLVRPDWFQSGTVMNIGQVVDIGADGAIWAGTQFKSFALVGSAVIGTNDPAFYVGRMVQQVTLVAGTINVTNVGIRSATKSAIIATRAAAGGTVTATVGYGTLAAMTPGYIGTATAAVTAYIANMTIQNADTSNLNIIVTNW